MTCFRILFGIGLLAMAIIVWFFLLGVADGSISAFNILMWLGLLAVPGGILGGGWWLRGRGRPRAANAVLALLAVPAAGMGLFFLLLIVSPGRWN